MRDTVSNHFLAALGIHFQFDRVINTQLQHFYLKALNEYRKEVQVERARLMRQVPCDYRAVRKLDREMDDVSCQLREITKGA